jgi:hypothetical protein
MESYENARARNPNRGVKMPKRRKSEFEYIMSIGDELGKYVDQWIAVVGEKIIASDEDIVNVYRKAKEECATETPFIMKVPSDRVMVL